MPHPIDTQWFKAQLAMRKRSMRGLAQHLGCDVSRVSRMLAGEWRLRIEEVDAIARFLDISPAQVLAHAGLDVTDGPAWCPTPQVLADVDGRPTHAVLSWADWLRVKSILEG